MKTTSYKRFLTIMVLTLTMFGIRLNAQMEVSANFFPPYPTNFGAWLSDQTNYSIKTLNATDETYNYFMRVALTGVGGDELVLIEMNDAYVPDNFLTADPLSLNELTSFDLEMLYANLSEDDLNFSDNIEIGINTELPEGVYVFCFQLFNADAPEEPLSEQFCTDAFTINQANIELLHPMDGSVWENTDIPVNFNWINTSSDILTNNYDYTLSIYELDLAYYDEESPYEYINSSTEPFHREEGITDLTYIYDPAFGNPEFQEGQIYAAQVALIDTDGYYDNDSKSNIITFWYGHNPFGGEDDDTEEDVIECFERCSPSYPTNQSAMSTADLESFTIGNFEVFITENNNPGDAIDGTGYIQLDMLGGVRIQVGIDGVLVNTDGKAIQGSIQAIENPQLASYRTEVMDLVAQYTPLDDQQREYLHHINSSIDNIIDMANGIPLGVPFGLQQVVQDQAFSFMVMGFRADCYNATFDFITHVNVDVFDAEIDFTAGRKDVCVAPDGLGQAFVVNMLYDRSETLDGGMEIKLKGGQYIEGADYGLRENQSPCYINFNCEGIGSMNISGEVTFPQDMVIKEVDGNIVGERAKGYFSASYTNEEDGWTDAEGQSPYDSDIMMAFTMDDFQLPKMPGWGFSIDNATIDISDVDNPLGFEFPDQYEYDGADELFWKGIFVKDATLSSPKSLADGYRGTATINNLYFENTLSFDIEGHDVLDRNKANIKGWGIGIDRFELEVVQNNIIDGMMKGKANSPVFADSDYLNYSAVLNQVPIDSDGSSPSDSYHTFDGLVRAEGDVSIPFAIGEASLCQNSYLSARLTPVKSDQLVELFMKGDIILDIGQQVSEINDAYLNLADYQIHYNSVGGFIGQDEVTDGRGSYFGAPDNTGINCSDLNAFTLQESFDYMIGQMQEMGENIYRDVQEQVVDVVEEVEDQVNEALEWSGFPISFNRSKLSVIQGAPKLELKFDMQVSPESIVEAGIDFLGKIEGQQEINDKYRIVLGDINTFFNQGMLTIEAPVDQSEIAMNEELNVVWDMNLNNDLQLNRLTYRVMICEAPESSLSLGDLFYDANNHILYKENVSGLSHAFSLSEVGVLQEGTRYAVRVQASDPQEEPIVNNGWSDVVTFFWGQGDDTVVIGESPCGERCTLPAITNRTLHPNPTNLTSIKMGSFLIELEEAPQQSGDLINGFGKVKVDFLNEAYVRVRYNNVKVNNQGVAFSGDAAGVPAEGSLATTLITGAAGYIEEQSNSDVISELYTYLDEFHTIGAIASSGTMTMPFGIDVGMKDGGNNSAAVKVAFTELKLEPQQANTKLIYLMSIPEFADGFNMGIGGRTCLSPEGFGGEVDLYLQQDVIIPVDGDLEYAFRGRNVDNSDQSCYLSLDCDGVKSLNIVGYTDFPTSMIVKEDLNLQDRNEVPQVVRGLFHTQLERSTGGVGSSGSAGLNLMFDMSIDPFQITALQGWGFHVSDVVLDLSEVENPIGITFPEGYDAEVSDLWKGVYIKEAKIKTPKNFTDDNYRGEIAVSDIIADQTLTLKIDVERDGFLPQERTNIKGWGIGIDRIALEILQNNLQHGELHGKANAPIFDENSYLNYSAIIDQSTSEELENPYYVFDGIVRAENDVQIPSVIGSASLCQNSYLAMRLTPVKEDQYTEVFLKGDMDIDIGRAGEIITGQGMMNLADYQIHYTSVEGFISQEELSDGRGSYFGMDRNLQNNCTDISYTELQEYFDVRMEEMAESGESVFRSISETINEIDDEDYIEDIEMDGMPLRFSKSKLKVVDGAPELNLIMELQYAADEIMEAGIMLKGGVEFNDSKYRVVFDRADVYFNSGGLKIIGPINDSEVSSSIPMPVRWEMGIQDQVRLRRLRYNLMIVERPEGDDVSYESLFADPTNYIINISGLTGSSKELSMEEIEPLLSDTDYLLRMQAIDPEEEYLINDGYSNIVNFTYGINLEDLEQGNSVCCSPDLPEQRSEINDHREVSSFTIGNFTVDNLDIPLPVEDNMNGTGEVTLTFMNKEVKVKVDLVNVRVNDSRQAVGGEVKGHVDDADMLANISNFIASGTNIELIDQINTYLDETRMIANLLSGQAIGMPFGITVGMESTDGSEMQSGVKLGISNMRLTPEAATADILFMMSAPDLGEGFSMGIGSNVCISPRGFGEADIFLQQDLIIPVDGDLEYAFRGRNVDNPDQSCYLSLDCDGVKSLNIAGYADFPTSMIVKEDLNLQDRNEVPQVVRGLFHTQLERSTGDVVSSGSAGLNLMFDMSIDPFQITALQGWGFHVSDVVLDLSEVENPIGITFPAGYDAEVSDLWKGVYIKEAKIKTPKNFTDDNYRGEIAVSDIIADQTLTLKIDVERDGFLPQERTNIKGWGIGIDRIALEILQNNLQSGELHGKANAPIFDENSYLNYSAIIDQSTSEELENPYYVFDGLVRAENDVQIPSVIGSASLCQNSYLAMRLTPVKEDQYTEVFLKGDIDIDIGRAGEIITGQGMMNLADYQIHYTSVEGFISQEELSDGRGSYFGMDRNLQNNCTDISYTELQEYFDVRMEEMAESGESVFRSISETINEIDDEDYIEDIEMDGMPLRFSKSKLKVVDGAPELNLIMKLQYAADEIMEAGIMLKGGIDFNDSKYRVVFDRADVYFNSGGLKIIGPINDSEVSSSIPMPVRWEMGIQDQVRLGRLRYNLMIVERPEGDDVSYESLFADPANYIINISGLTGSSRELSMEEIGPLLSDTDYLLRMQAIDPEEEYLINDGYSNIVNFRYGISEINLTQGDSECCSPPMPQSAVPVNDHRNITSFTIGNFTVNDLEIPLPVEDNMNGTGIVTLDFMKNVKVKVDIVNVIVNDFGQAIGGSVKGHEDNNDMIDNISNFIASGTNIELIDQINNYLDETRLIGNLLTGQAIGVPFALTVGMESNGGTEMQSGAKFAVSNLNFTPEDASVDILFLMSAPELGDGFNMGIGSTTCLSPQGFGETEILLQQDIDIPFDANTSLRFIGASNNLPKEQTCYVKLSCQGFEELNLVGGVDFSKDLMVKEDPVTRQRLNDPVQGRFAVNLTRSVNNASPQTNADHGFVLALDMDPFQLKKLEGWSFTVNEAVFDLSETSNYGSMQFPEGYDDSDLPDEEFWKGFYLKELTVRAPADFTAENGNDESGYFTTNDLLIDPRFSANISGGNILSYKDGTVKGWGVSIDGFNLNILQNTFQSASMNGLLGSPLQEDGELLAYTATIGPDDTTDDDSPYVFNAVVHPQEDIHIPMFKDNMTVCQSSYLGMQLGLDKENTHMEIFLKGNIGINIQEEDVELAGNLKFDLAAFQVQYNTSQGFVKAADNQEDGKGTKIGLGLAQADRCDVEYMPDFDQIVASMDGGMNIGFNNEVSLTSVTDSDGGSSSDVADDEGTSDNALNNFQFRLHDFDIAMQEGAPLFGFAVDLGIMDGNDGFKAGTSVTIKTKKVERADGSGKTKIKFDKLRFDEIRLLASTEAFTLAGCLAYTNKSIEGTEGTLKGYDGTVLFKAGKDETSIMANLSAGFFTYRESGDNVVFGTERYHGIGWVDGAFSMSPGIPLGPMSLHGVGGGVYWNIAAPSGFAKPDEFYSEEATSMNSPQCANELLNESGNSFPGMVVDANIGKPVYEPPGNTGSTYRKRTLKFSAGLSMLDGKLLAMDPQLQATWTVQGDGDDQTASGLNEIQANGYMYFLQGGYMSRGAGSQPVANNGNGESIEDNAKTVTDSWLGSKIWMSGFNSLYLQYTSDKVLPFFESRGQLYMNLVPEVLKGAGPNYKLIEHEIIIGNVNHELADGYAKDNVEGSTYWHAYFGNPYDAGQVSNTEVTSRGAITLDLLGMFKKDGEAASVANNVQEVDNVDPNDPDKNRVDLTAYIMAGHGIPNVMPPIPDFILNLADVASDSDDKNGGDINVGEFDENAEYGRSASLSNSTSGFVTGANIYIGLGFEKVVYANLRVMLGMDIMLRNVGNAVCNGANGTDPIGLNGFYGTGQAYAGIEGDLGVRGKIFGKEIDVEILYFAARTILEAGGPNPFWMRGSADLRYRVLNGLIKGNAHLEFNAGEPCYPVDASPFTLDAIHKVYPSEENDNNYPAGPYDQPMVTFKMPVAKNAADATNHYIPVVELIGEDADNMTTNTTYIAPYVKTFKVYKGHKYGVAVKGEIDFSESHRSVQYIPNSTMGGDDQETENKPYRFHVEIGAKESDDRVRWTTMDYVQDTIVDFYVSPLPPYEDYIKFSNPIKGQQYFMEDEWNAEGGRNGMIHWIKDIREGRFYSERRGKTYEYDIVIKDQNGHEVHRNTLQQYQFKPHWTEFSIPSLERDMVYVLQLVRRRTNPPIRNIFSGEKVSYSFDQLTNVDPNSGITAEYVIEVEEDDEDAFDDVNQYETLLHHVVFKTSKYHNLNEKLAATRLEGYRQFGGTLIPKGNFNRVKITDNSEPFDKVELNGRYNRAVINNRAVPYYTQPRIFIYDPLSGPFYEDQLKPEMNELLSQYRSEIDGHDIGLRINTQMVGNGNHETATVLYDRSKITTYSDFVDWGAYDNESDEMYGNMTQRLKKFVTSFSLIMPLLPQTEPEDSAIADILGSLGNIHIMNANRDVLVQDPTKTKVRQNISITMNLMEQTLDEILYPAYPISAANTFFQRRNLIMGTIEAYNDVIGSYYYNGDAKKIFTGMYNFGSSGIKTPLSFKSSNIEFKYNIKPVHQNVSYYQDRFGSNVVKNVNLN